MTFAERRQKRKWRWKAYAQKEWDWWATFVQAALVRASGAFLSIYDLNSVPIARSYKVTLCEACCYNHSGGS